MILFRYIFREWAKIFGISLFVVLGLILVQEVYSKLDGLLSRGARLSEIMGSMVWSIPVAMPSILPVVLLLSVLFSVGVLHRKNEITAMKAAGLSLGSVMTPLLIGAGLCALTMLAINAWLIPFAADKQEALRANLFQRAAGAGVSDRAAGRIDNLGFLNFREQRLWLISGYYPHQQQGDSAVVFERDNEGRERYRVMASRVWRDPRGEGWHFEQGRELFFDGLSREPFRSRPFETLHRPDFSEEPDVMLALRSKPHEIPFSLLRRLLDQYEGRNSPEVLPYRVRFFRLILAPLSCFLVVGFAVPFVASGVRVNPMIGISKAFGMFILYFAVANLSGILGSRGWVSPLMAALIPLLMIGLISVPVIRRAR